MPIIDRVCPECSALDGRQIGMDELFFSGNRVEYDESGLYPPLHPRCACAVQYVEVESETFMTHNQEKEYGVRYGDEAILADRKTLDSPEYRRKFDGISANQDIDEKICTYARKAIYDNDGRLTESMYLFDANNGNVIAAIDKEQDKIESGIRYTADFKERLQEAREKGIRIIALHNHPEGYPPSADDFRKAYENGYIMGIVAGANGQLYSYFNDNVSLTKSDCDSIHTQVAENYLMGYDVDRAYNDIYRAMGLSYNIIHV